jgi:putative tricarboxylic transport membrane protein
VRARVANKDTIAGVLLLALAGAYWLATRRIPESSLSDDVGPTGLPSVLAVALAILAAILTAKGLAAARAAAAEADEDDERAPLARALGFALIGAGYMAVASFTGYALGVALLIVAVALYERERLSLRLAAVAAAGGIGFWLIFVKLLGTIQPVSRFWA